MDQNAGTTQRIAAMSVPTLSAMSIVLVLIGVVLVLHWRAGAMRTG